MKKFKKLLLGLAGVAAISTLVACGDDNRSSSGHFTYMGVIWEPHPEDPSDIMLEVFERTGTTVEFQWFPSEMFQERIAVTLASGELPDVISGGGIAALIAEEALLPLDDLLERYGQNILAAVGDDLHLLRNADTGNIYTIPNIIDFPPAMAMQIRQDWLDELGLPVPNTWDEWMAAWRGFQTLGDNIVPLAGDIFQLMPAFGMNVNNRFGFMIDEQGRYTLAFEHPNFRSFLETMRDLYAEGILDREFSTRGTLIGGNPELEAAFQANIAGSAMTWAANTRTTSEVLRDGGVENATLIGVAPIQGPYGHRGIHSRAMVSGGSAITIAAEDRAAEIVQFFDYLFSPEGMRLMSFGIEGQHHEIIDGVPVLQSPYVDSFAEARGAGLNFTPIAHRFERDAFMQLTLAGQTVEELTETQLLFYNALTVGEPYFFTPNINVSTQAFRDRNAMVFPIIEQIMAEAIIGRITVDEFFEQYEALRDQGLQDILDQGAEAWERIAPN